MRSIRRRARCARPTRRCHGSARERDPARVRGTPPHWSSRPRSTASSSSTLGTWSSAPTAPSAEMVELAAVARRGPAVDRARGRRSRPTTHFASLPATGQGTLQRRGAGDLPRVADLGDPRRPAPAAAARPRRDRRPGGRPDDPVAVQVPAGPRRGPDAPHAPDQRGDRGRAQPHRARPARRAGAGRLGRVAVARGGAADDQGRRRSTRARHPRQDPRGARRRRPTRSGG